MNDIYDAKNYEEKKWEIDINGKYTNVIKEYLLRSIPIEGVEKTVDNAKEILGYCPDPNSQELCNKTGIVIGKVQSGKTSNFITLSALAFDNGYNLITIFGGTKNILVTQTKDRLKEYFQDAPDVYILDSVAHKSQLTGEKIQRFVNMGKKVIIVALKTPKNINYIKDNVFSDSEINTWPTLVIDDEGDEASLNGLVFKNKKTSTYRAIEELKDVLLRHCFLSVTATPQANMLIDALDVLSPEFGVLIDPGEGYCGLEVFHSSEKYTIEIPEDEQSLLDDGIPNSFIEALALFFVGCGIFKSRLPKPDDKFAMLIHPSQKKIDHEAVYEKVKATIDEWRSFFTCKDDISYFELRKILLNAYLRYKSDGYAPIPSFEDIEEAVLSAITNCGLHIVNDENALNDADSFYEYNIYVGGTMLGRGLTLKGLAITYIIRTPKGRSNVDTLEQRARWFGYKEKYLDLCRVFAVPKIIKEFMDIRDHEEDLWGLVQNAHLQGTRFKDIVRIFTLSSGLLMTRSNVGRTSRYTFNFWNKQKIFQDDPDYIRSNINVLTDFRKRNLDTIHTKRYGEGAPYTIIPSRFETVKQEILDHFLFPNESTLNKAMLDRLGNILHTKELNPSIDVIWMRDAEGQYSKHRIDCLKIPNYSVGRRPKDRTKEPVYLGDDYQFKTYDRMQLQIHMIQDINTQIVSPTLVLYLPVKVVEKLTNLVIRENI